MQCQKVFRKVKHIVGEMRYGIKYFFMNSIVARIPIWHVRKFLYQCAGMKIGRSHILMYVITDGWKHIEIGDGVCINSYCHIDGRGGIKIHDNVSISVYTKILSASHDKDSGEFAYIEKSVEIEDNVWTGINSVILPGTTMRHGSILAAGSVAIGKVYEECGVYSGVPAIKIANRKLTKDYDLSQWAPWFR